MDVMKNGPTLPKTQVVEGVETVMPITSVENKAQRRLEVKARSTLMIGIPNEHQLKLNSIKDAKQLMEAIEKSFGEWNTYVVVWRNKSDLDTMSMDDLYNNLKVFEPEVKGMLSSNSSTQNMAFVSSSNNNNTNGAVNNAQAANTANGVSTADTQVNNANIDKLSDAVICAFLASQPSSPQLVNEDLDHIHPDDLKEMDLKWQMAIAPRAQDNINKESTRRNVSVETTNSSALMSCDGLRVEERFEIFKTNESIYSEDIKKLKFEIHCNKITIKELRKKLETIQKENDGIQLTVEKLENASNSLNKLIDSQIVDNYKKGVGYNAILPPHTGLFMPPKPDLSYIGLEEFTSEHAVETLNAKTSKYVPKLVKNDNGASIIED
nr:hypothetical protein [Tanacetum cinerariifolium]